MRLIGRDELSGLGAVYLVDARPTELYAGDHPEGAVNVTLSMVADPITGRTLDVGTLARNLSGVGPDRPVVVYDMYDGSAAARVAATLEHCGHSEVYVLRHFVSPRVFRGLRVARGGGLACNPTGGVYVDDVEGRDAVLVDTRDGPLDGIVRRDIHLPYTAFLARDGIVPVDPRLPSDRTYYLFCGQGHKAAIVYVVLRHFGYSARLLDGGLCGVVCFRGGPLQLDQA